MAPKMTPGPEDKDSAGPSQGGGGLTADEGAGISPLIDLKVLPEGPRNHFPVKDDGVASDSAYRSDAFVKGHVLRLRHPVPLFDPGLKIPPYYLVWPERSKGEVIVGATYETQVEGTTGQRSENPTRIPVPFDTDSRRWFIPVMDLFQGSKGPILGTDLYLIFLELELEGGAHAEVQVEFQVSGGLIPQGIRLVAHKDGLPPTRLFGGLAREGWVFMEDIIRNPVDRTLKLWFRLQGADFTVHEAITDLKAHLPLPGPPQKGDLFPASTVLTVAASGKLRLEGFRVSVGGEPEVFQKARSSDWIAMVLGPSEEVTIKGWAAVTPDTRPCPYSIPGNSVDSLRVEGSYLTETAVSEVDGTSPDPGRLLQFPMPTPVAIGMPSPPRLNMEFPNMLL